MGLDIRLPIGLISTLIGSLFAVFGLIKGSEPVSLDINLIWAAALLVFGALLLKFRGLFIIGSAV